MSRKIATLSDIKDTDDDNNRGSSGFPSDSSRHGQAFYAGGSEHSGQQILGPNRDGVHDPNRFVENFFNQASRAQRVGDLSDSNGSGATVGGPSTGGANNLPITFWRNGFTISDEDELHPYINQDSQQFLDCLRRGATPPELAHRVRGGMVDVKLENRAQEDFKPKLKAFSGKGYRLGAPSPDTADSAKKEPPEELP